MPYESVVPEGATVDIAYLLDRGMKAVTIAGQAVDRALSDKSPGAVGRRDAAAQGLIATVLDLVAGYYKLPRLASFDKAFLSNVPSGEMTQVKTAAANVDLVAAGHHWASDPADFADIADTQSLPGIAESLYGAYFGDVQRLAHPVLPDNQMAPIEKDLKTSFDWPWVPESDFSDAVGAWPEEHLKGVSRDEAIERIEALVGAQIRNLHQARTAIYFFDGTSTIVPEAERPAAGDPDWEKRALAALGRAAMRDVMVSRFDDADFGDEEEGGE